MSAPLTIEEQNALLKLARQALEAGVQRQPLPAPDWERLPPRLVEPGASFVTLTRQGSLRGCIGMLEAVQPLAADVQQHAVEAALDDPRFMPVQPTELAEIHIEVSVLTPPQDLPYDTPADLPHRLRPMIDGVTLFEGRRRATFLPQVWEMIPDPEEFLSRLCEKMGASPNLWRTRKLAVQTYQVQEFHE